MQASSARDLAEVRHVELAWADREPHMLQGADGTAAAAWGLGCFYTRKGRLLMRTAEIKRRFLAHFERNGHTIVPSAPLPAIDDRTCCS